MVGATGVVGRSLVPLLLALRTEGTRLLLEASTPAESDAYLQQSITLAYPDCGDRWLE